MVYTFKNLHLLTGVSDEVKEKMDHAARQHKQFNNLNFKVIESEPEKVVIQVSQGKNSAEVYHDLKRLIEIVHETFDRFFPGIIVMVHPIPFVAPPVDIVNMDWINAQMLQTGTKLKQIAVDTGIDYTTLSALTNGIKPLSQSMRAMFYFYFRAKELEPAKKKRTFLKK